MAFSSLFSRLRSCSKPICRNLRTSNFQRPHIPSSLTEPVTCLRKGQGTIPSWVASLIPLALAVSAGSLALQSQNYPSRCLNDAPLSDPKSVKTGGKGSTDYVVKGSLRKVPPELIEELKGICQDNMTMDEDERYVHGKPQNSFHKAVNIPDVVVYPRSEEEVSKIVKSCNMHKVPIVPYGGATSIEGHTLSPYGGVCIDMTLMNCVKALHVEDMDVVVEPGIGWMELNEYLESYGLFFPLDPGPGATIGGMCATRCSGSLAVRYGTMRDNVINLKVVLADGEVMKTASRARKSAAGYDLTRLLIGSEGTLGVITEITLRLQKLPQSSVESSIGWIASRENLWQGNKERKGYHLVKWKTVITEKRVEGLGIKNKKNQSKTLRMKWLWKYSNDNQNLWGTIINAKYEESDSWMTQEVTTPYGVSLWKSVRKLWNEFKPNIKIEVSSGLETGQDRLQWLGNSKGIFKVGASYRKLNLQNLQLLKWCWRDIWKAKIPYKVSCFVWLLAKKAVLTREFNEEGTVNHLFIQCKVTG
ncbi:hypothetical protein H5410_057392 [Solanum commersonii]|uniref:FAD-binding PCMH-type domain-containing protein n=1 Tax=Solanum commersonii TaxID=4109 RepID=A0A9J5WNW4_SOLCO|nr:hypothetical protein H5410_057392 [Solanum commersonii]